MKKTWFMIILAVFAIMCSIMAVGCKGKSLNQQPKARRIRIVCKEFTKVVQLARKKVKFRISIALVVENISLMLVQGANLREMKCLLQNCHIPQLKSKQKQLVATKPVTLNTGLVRFVAKPLQMLTAPKKSKNQNLLLQNLSMKQCLWQNHLQKEVKTV